MGNRDIKRVVLIAFLAIQGYQAYACGEHSFFSVDQLLEIRSENYVGNAPTAFSVGHRWQLNDHWYGGIMYRHQSNIGKGWPVNGDYESWYDAAGFTLEGRF